MKGAQHEAVENNDQTVSLKATIVAMRSQMEEMRGTHQQALQHAELESSLEIAELHKTIRALRDEMEQLRADSRGQLQLRPPNSPMRFSN